MPSLATGTNMYRPLEGTHGATSSTLLHKTQPEAEAEDNGESPPACNHGAAHSDGHNEDRDQSPPPPPTSPPSSPSLALPKAGTSLIARPASESRTSMSYPSAGTTSTPSMSTASKRKLSALHASQSNASVTKRQRTTTGAVALNGIKESLDAFNSTLGRSLALQQPGPDRVRADTSPERRARAMDVLQDQESYLDDNQMVAFIDMFRVDTAAADAYLAIKHVSLQKKWVEKQLKDTLGFPPMPL